MSAQYADGCQTITLWEGKQHSANNLSGQFVCCPGEERREEGKVGVQRVESAKGGSGKHGQEKCTKERDRALTGAARELGQNRNRRTTKNGLW